MAAGEAVIVAVKAGKVISKAALSWALGHVVRPGDCIILLAVLPGQKAGRKLWNFPWLSGDCRSTDLRSLPDQMSQISESCSQMMLQLHDQVQVKVRIKVLTGLGAGAVAAEAKSTSVNWVILDKNLKQELKCCMEELHCNIVAMKGCQPKVLRLNLGRKNEIQPLLSSSSSPALDSENLQGHRVKHCTPVSSPEGPFTSNTMTLEESSLSSLETRTSLFLVYEQNPLFEGQNEGKYATITTGDDLAVPLNKMGLDDECVVSPLAISKSSLTSTHKKVFWLPQNHVIDAEGKQNNHGGNCRSKPFAARNELGNSIIHNPDKSIGGSELSHSQGRDFICSSRIREVVSLAKSSSIPPPLCSICQHKAPAFGKPPRRFHYAELTEATCGFSDINFLAEGGFGLLHKGFLGDGLVVAIKQLKFAGPQGDADFCREVQLMSCAQHRNVVLLIGFCIEEKKRALVYEFVCNSSLDFHLYGNKETPLDWNERLKIAIGTARGLRYLHEDCRVGRIVHRDMRPKNILLTHDYEPLVADFGLARLHSEWAISDGDRILGTSGYLAPEYVGRGKITEKVDVYAFGLILLELISDHKHLLSECIYPFTTFEQLEVLAYKHHHLEHSLASFHLENMPREHQAMGCAASLCLQTDPDFRPPMSKVLGILERGNSMIHMSSDVNSSGSRSGHMMGLSSKPEFEARQRHYRKLSH